MPNTLTGQQTEEGLAAGLNLEACTGRNDQKVGTPVLCAVFVDCKGNPKGGKKLFLSREIQTLSLQR